jgi:hypothetical protein
MSNLKLRPSSYESIIQTTRLLSLMSEVEAITYSQTHDASLCCCIMLCEITAAPQRTAALLDVRVFAVNDIFKH